MTDKFFDIILCTEVLEHVPEPIKAIEEFSGYILEVNLVKNSWCEDEEIKELEHKISEITSGMELRINFVEDIPAARRGKRNHVINEDEELLKKWGGVFK